VTAELLALLLLRWCLQVVSSTLAGAALGSLTGGGFADALGRRASFMLCALPMLVGPLLSATANSLNMMVAGRFLAGIAIGLSSALVPLYISEVRAGRCFCCVLQSLMHWLAAAPTPAKRRTQGAAPLAA
jgi:MFS family permease